MTVRELKKGDRFIECGRQWVRDGYDKETGYFKAHRIGKDGESIFMALYVGNEEIEKVVRR